MIEQKAGERPGDVGRRLARPHPHLVAPQRDRVPAQRAHGHLAGDPGPGRWLLEQQGHAVSGQRVGHGARVGLPGQGALEERGQLGRGQIVQLEQAAGAHAATACSAPARIETARAISSSPTRSGGASRRAVGVTALTTSPSARQRVATAADEHPGTSSAPRRRPRPRTLATCGALRDRPAVEHRH